MAGDVASAVQWISSLLVRETIALVQVADQVESLKEELEVMQGYLRDADAMQQKAEVRTLTDQIRKLAYDMEDVIDKYIIKVESRNTKQGYRKWFVKLACFLRNTPKIYLVRQDIESIRSRMKDKREQLNSCGIRGVTEPRAGFRSLSYNRRNSRKKPQSYPLENSHEYIVGLEKDVLGLVKILNGEGNHRTNILAIVGMGGSGKTTLAKKLYNHPYHLCFDFFAWVVISQKWSTEKILFEILRKSGASVDLNATKEQLVDQLGLVLKNKSYLVVFDDVWHKQDLEEILPILLQSNSKEGSKIIITTRKREVIDFKHLQKLVYVHEAKPLNDDHAWELFSSIVFNQVSNCNIESFENLGKKMLKKCGGLPLAIIALAGILSSKGSITEWQHVSKAVHTKVMQSRGLTTNDTVEDILALSYEDLPYDLKPCFLYLGVFPEDCQIPTGMLIRMWIAEGLVTAHDDDMSLEDIAMEYLVELGQRFLIQIARKNFMEQIKAIRVHDMLRDLCLKKAKQHGFLKTYTYDHDQVMNYASTSAIQPRRVALHSCISLPTHVSSTRSLVWLARSSNLLSESISQDMPVVDLQVVPQNFELLRLLNIWGVKTCTGTLPTEIGSLIHLRYLGICTTNITKLPKSIGNLRNLLTLDYRYVKSDMDAPIEIPNVLWQLKELRHLFLPIECDWNVKKLKLSTLKKLQTLWGVKEDGGGCWLSKELAGLSETLKKLMIVVSSQRELSDMFCCLSKISNKLDTFHCELRNNLVLKDAEPLSKYERPHKLRLIGRLQMKLSFLLPVNVIVLDLEDSELTEEDPMVTLGELAHLKFLRLSKSCLGTTFTCKAGSFPQLEKLFLHSLQNLNCWIIEEGAMVHLKTLEITRCMKLKDFPIGFAFMKNLEELEFFGMPAEFGEAAIANGWSRKKLRLPHNWESIIERSDSPVDISSVQKIYKQLTGGIYLNNMRQKFWVTKQDEVYYNCFMLYPSDLSLATRVDVDGLPLWNVQVDDWEFGELAESDGDLISEAKLRLPVIHVLDISGRLSVDDLSPNVTYTVTMVIWFDYSQVSVQSMLVLPGCRLETQKINLVERSRSEWVEVPVGEFKARPNLEGVAEFYLHFQWARPSKVEFEVKGVIVQPKSLAADV